MIENFATTPTGSGPIGPNGSVGQVPIASDNPYASPTAEGGDALEHFNPNPINPAKLAAYSFGLQSLNWSFVVSLAFASILFFINDLGAFYWAIWFPAVLSFGILICMVLAVMFMVFPIYVSLPAFFTLWIPFTWPVTLFAINSRARQLLVQNGMTVGLFGRAEYVAQMVDGPSRKPNQFDMTMDRAITYGVIISCSLLITWLVFS